MATVAQEKEDDKVGQPQQMQQQQDPGTQTLQGSGGPTSSMAPVTPAYQPQQRGSGRFTNIRKYLSANEGAGEQLSSRIKKEGEESANKVAQGIQQSRARFGEQAGQIEQGVQAGAQAARTAYQDPNQINEQQRQQFGQLYGGGLQSQVNQLSPGDFTSQAQLQAQNLGQMAEASRTAPGRFGLLRQTIGRPGEQYSLGQQRLDDLFLQGTKSAGQLEQNLRGMAQNVQRQVGETTEEFNARTAGLKTLVDREKTAAENLLLRGEQEGFQGEQFGGGLEDIEANLQQRLQAAPEQARQDYQQLVTRLSSNQGLSDSDIERLGLQDVSNIYGAKLQDYITPEEALANPTLAGIASAQEAQRFKGLSSLIGREADIFGGAQQFGDYKPFDYQSDVLKNYINQQKELSDRMYKSGDVISSGQFSPEQAQRYLEQNAQYVTGLAPRSGNFLGLGGNTSTDFARASGTSFRDPLIRLITSSPITSTSSLGQVGGADFINRAIGRQVIDPLRDIQGGGVVSANALQNLTEQDAVKLFNALRQQNPANIGQFSSFVSPTATRTRQELADVVSQFKDRYQTERTLGRGTSGTASGGQFNVT